jgi:uncharacterized protein YkwD
MNLASKMTFALVSSFCLLHLSAFAENTWELVDATNTVRNQFGLPALRVDVRLMNSAATHARDMATRNYFSHSTPEGWGIGLRIYGWGYPGWAGIGENIAGGQNSAWEVVQSWLASPGHRANLLNGAYKALGAGHYFQSGTQHTNYWVGHYGTD